jgi:hypothetical protein
LYEVEILVVERAAAREIEVGADCLSPPLLQPPTKSAAIATTAQTHRHLETIEQSMAA